MPDVRVYYSMCIRFKSQSSAATAAGVTVTSHGDTDIVMLQVTVYQSADLNNSKRVTGAGGPPSQPPAGGSVP